MQKKKRACRLVCFDSEKLPLDQEPFFLFDQALKYVLEKFFWSNFKN
jgi:hypothetical protein